MSTKKPFTKAQKLTLGGIVGAALLAIAIKAALGPSGSTTVPHPPVPTPSRSALVHAPVQHPVPPLHTVSVSKSPGFIPQIHKPAVPPATKTSPAAGGLRAIDLVQSASGGTVWGVYAASLPNHPGWYAVLYRTRIAAQDRFAIAWANLQQHLVVLGSVIGAHGQAWTSPANFLLEADRHGVHLPQYLESRSRRFRAARLKAWDATGIAEGHSGPRVTVFFDPNSAQAARLYTTISAFVRSGKMQVNWVPIAVLRKSSLYRAEYMLSAPLPSVVLKDDLAHFHYKKQKGGSPNLYNAPTSMMELVDNNANILANTGRIGPFAIVYCQNHTLRIRYHLPKPDEWPRLLGSLSNACS